MSALPDPVQPQSMEQRIANALTEIRDRLASIRKDRPRTSANTSAPSGATLDGTRHMDTDDRRFYVHSSGEWISADSQRWVVTDNAQVQTAGGRWTDLGGPVLSVYVAEPAMVMIYAEAEVFGNAWTCGLGTCLTRAEVGLWDSRWGAHQRLLRSIGYNTWERRVSTGYQEGPITNGSTDSDGAVWPRGGFYMVWLENPGSYDFKLHYAAVDESVGGGQPAQTVWFRNRLIYGLAL